MSTQEIDPIVFRAEGARLEVIALEACLAGMRAEDLFEDSLHLMYELCVLALENRKQGKAVTRLLVSEQTLKEAEAYPIGGGEKCDVKDADSDDVCLDASLEITVEEDAAAELRKIVQEMGMSLSEFANEGLSFYLLARKAKESGKRVLVEQVVGMIEIDI